MQPNNLLFILSDEHQRDITGCYGDPIAITPNIDALAARGVRFTQRLHTLPHLRPGARRAGNRPVGASDASHGTTRPPITVSRRAGTTGCARQGHRVVSIGKLHFRATDDDNGFSEEILPLHVLDGQRRSDRHAARAARRSAAACRRWPRAPGRANRPTTNMIAKSPPRPADGSTEGRRASDKPWALFVSLVRPHFPLTAPPEFFALYPPERMPLPRLYDDAGRPRTRRSRRCGRS